MVCSDKMVEIYNSVSNVHMSRRPDSSLIVDMVASEGLCLPLLATDDAHYYDGDECKSFVMVEAESSSPEDLMAGLRAGAFYASQGPEVHLFRDGDEVAVRCSPCCEVVFLSNIVWTKDRVTEGTDITEARYTPKEQECFVRAMVTDSEGRRAWSQILPLSN